MLVIKKQESAGKCLTDRVGFTGCGDTVHEVNIDERVGIKEIVMASVYEPSTYEHFQDHYKALKVAAYKKMRMYAKVELGKFKRFRHVVHQSDSPKRNSRILESGVGLVGVKIEIPYNLDAVLRLTTLNIHVRRMAEDVPIVIYDMESLEPIHQIQSHLVEGMNHIPILIEIVTVHQQGGSVFVGIPADVLRNGLDCSPTGDCGCYTMKGDVVFTTGYISACGASDFSPCESVDVGVCVSAEIGCDIDNFICRNPQLFLPLYEYYEAEQHYLATIGSSRINYYQKSQSERTAQIYLPLNEKETKQAWVVFRNEVQPYIEDSYCFLCDPNTIAGVYAGNSFGMLS